MRSKHVPNRRCVVCGTRSPKRELQRVVLTEAGTVAVDESGKRAGRGAYLCERPLCWQKAAQGKQVSRALRADLHERDIETLMAHADSMAGTSKGQA